MTAAVSNNSNGKDAKHLLWIGGAIIVCTSVAYFLFQINEGHCEMIKLDMDQRCEQINNDVKFRYEDLKDHIHDNNALIIEVRNDIKKLGDKIK